MTKYAIDVKIPIYSREGQELHITIVNNTEFHTKLQKVGDIQGNYQLNI
ncbi:hypothetical protein SRABI96_01036 [Peribacillus sp. Bi96]|nr:hypothetical protein SRABI96_01036 [Peribacillus sp. Bi96]